MPIKQHQDIFLGSVQARLLEIASVPLESGKPSAPGSPSAIADAAKDDGYRSGIVFAIDTTQSMRPYIKRTREVVRKVFDTIEAAGLRGKVNFGLTAFRDAPGSRKKNYTTRTFVTLKEGDSPERFFKNVDAVSPDGTSNKDFTEDGFAGIAEAIKKNDWEGFNARYVIVVTDASSREADDPLSSTHLDAKALRQLAQDKGIAIWVLHLRTPMGAEDHAKAEQQYKEISYYPDIGDFYYGVGMGEVDEFGLVLETLASQVTQQVQDAAKGAVPTAEATDTKKTEGELASLQEKVSQLGYALQMRYLHDSKKEKPPAVFNAWVMDRDFRDPEKSPLEVRVLLTRDQLSDLKSILQQVLNLAEEGVLSPKNFLNELKSLAATLSRNPAAINKGEGSNLAELGYMREYIEDLPYKSEVMGLSLEDWENWSAKQQLEFTHRLESKVSYYQALHDHTDLWVSPGGGPVTGDSVFPILLEMLP